METNKNKRVFGVYQNEADAQRAVDELTKLGYSSDEISVLSRSDTTMNVDGVETSTEAGLKGGAATGAAIGGIGGLLTSLGLLVIPGIGPILAAGPIAATFAGAIAGTAIGGAIGTIGGAMMDAGVSEDDARYIDERFGAGDIIVYVDADAQLFDNTSQTLGYRRWNNPVGEDNANLYRDFEKPADREFRTDEFRNQRQDDDYVNSVNSGDAMITSRNNHHTDLKTDFDQVENKVQDTFTDTKHDVEKTAEKISRRVDNAGEPLEDVQNWAGDRVSDVKHEAGKVIDKTKNRMDD